MAWVGSLILAVLTLPALWMLLLSAAEVLKWMAAWVAGARF